MALKDLERLFATSVSAGDRDASTVIIHNLIIGQYIEGVEFCLTLNRRSNPHRCHSPPNQRQNPHLLARKNSCVSESARNQLQKPWSRLET